jgi:hypothetical protein
MLEWPKRANQENLGAARMFVEEFGYIIDLLSYYDPCYNKKSSKNNI